MSRDQSREVGNGGDTASPGGAQPPSAPPTRLKASSATHPLPHTPGFTGTGEGAELANCLPCASVWVHRYFVVRNGGGNREAQRG